MKKLTQVLLLLCCILFLTACDKESDPTVEETKIPFDPKSFIPVANYDDIKNNMPMHLVGSPDFPHGFISNFSPTVAVSINSKHKPGEKLNYRRIGINFNSIRNYVTLRYFFFANGNERNAAGEVFITGIGNQFTAYANTEGALPGVKGQQKEFHFIIVISGILNPTMHTRNDGTTFYSYSEIKSLQFTEIVTRNDDISYIGDVGSHIITEAVDVKYSQSY
ncbi:MAG: hypothetical protein ACFCUU_05025 [Cyclobacteriaceae bacterium]